MTKKELIARANELNIATTSKMTVAELEKLIAEAEQPAKPEKTEQTAEQRRDAVLTLLKPFTDAHDDVTTKPGINARANSVIFNYKKRRIARVQIQRNDKVLIQSSSARVVVPTADALATIAKWYDALATAPADADNDAGADSETETPEK